MVPFEIKVKFDQPKWHLFDYASSVLTIHIFKGSKIKLSYSKRSASKIKLSYSKRSASTKMKTASKNLFLARLMIFFNRDLHVITVHAKPINRTVPKVL